MAEPRKVAFLITRADDVGGAQIHVRDLAVAMRDRGTEVVVLAGGDGAFGDLLREASIPFRSVQQLSREIRPTRDLAAVWEVAAHLRALQPDLVAIHSSKAGIVGRLAARWVGIPAVFTAHGWAFTGGVPALKSRLYAVVERLVGQVAGAVITVSEHDRQLAASRGVVPDSRLHTVHNGVPDVTAALRSTPGRDPPRLITIARLAAQKAPLDLLHALTRVTGAWTIDVVGDGPLRAVVEREIDALGLASRVRLLGHRSDVAELLAQAQCFVLSSRWEGLPLTILEAMRAGLPVVATDVGGVPEAVTHGVTGLLAPAGSVQAFGDAVDELVSNPGKRTAMGDAGRKRFHEAFRFEDQLERTLGVYRGALATS